MSFGFGYSVNHRGKILKTLVEYYHHECTFYACDVASNGLDDPSECGEMELDWLHHDGWLF